MKDHGKEIEEISIEFKRDMIRKALAQLEQRHVDLFNKMYGSVERVKPNELNRAYDQCMRTLDKLKKE